MKIKPIRLILNICLLTAISLLTSPLYSCPQANAGDSTVQREDAKPVKVFVLMGQSNMLGFGRIGPEETQGTLEFLTKREGKYPHLLNAEGDWSVREDVHYIQTTVGNRQNPLTVKGKHIGTEIQFGHLMGDYFEEPVVILKACIGNRSLGWDLLPPGSEQFEFDGKIYAGYKETPLSWVEGEPKKEVNWYAGKQYDTDVGNAKKVLGDLKKFFPGYQGKATKSLALFGGKAIRIRTPRMRVDTNRTLVHLIKTLRDDFDAPKAKFVLATIAFGGDQLAGDGLTVANAQLAVSGDSGKYPEFSGNVKTVDARPFWKDKSVSPTGAGYHYNHNAETYLEVGDQLGNAMIELLSGAKNGSNDGAK